MPDAPNIQQMDFFDLNLNEVYGDTKLHFVGNPPFKTAYKMLKKIVAHKSTQSISWLLPASFKGEHKQKVFPTNYELVFQKDYNKKGDFLLGGNIKHPKKVKCVFQIWVKREDEFIRTKSPQKKYYDDLGKQSKYFNFVKKKDIGTAEYFIGTCKNIGILFDKKTAIEAKVLKLYENGTIALVDKQMKGIRLKDRNHAKLLEDKVGTKCFETDASKYVASPHLPKIDLFYGLDKLIESMTENDDPKLQMSFKDLSLK